MSLVLDKLSRKFSDNISAFAILSKLKYSLKLENSNKNIAKFSCYNSQILFHLAFRIILQKNNIRIPIYR